MANHILVFWGITRCRLILRVQLNRVDELSPRMGPAHSMDDVRPGGVVVVG